MSLAGPVNFRDVGGYAAADGKAVAWRRLYRSDSLHHLEESDGALLHERGIVTAIDFRADDELDRIGIGRLGELDIHHLHLPTVDKVLHTLRPPGWTPPESAVEVYVLMLRSGAAAYAATLRALAEPGTLPAVYFCMAGKDRTGVFSAVVLGLLGVSDADIVADYVLTHEVVDAIHARGKRDFPDGADHWPELPSALMGAEAETMEGMLVAMREQWGAWDDYVTDIGVEPGVVEALRAALLTEP
ncbi:MAG: tyrosine-protein phosphatase [Acidimicrobiia bacterium]|nr:tyrosine-protein phosphatase [Acidimicrobiia bacterium]